MGCLNCPVHIFPAGIYHVSNNLARGWVFHSRPAALLAVLPPAVYPQFVFHMLSL
jgi:hypothetical protein